MGQSLAPEVQEMQNLVLEWPPDSSKKETTFPSRIMMIKFSEIYVNVRRQLQVNFATSKRKKIQINAKKIL